MSDITMPRGFRSDRLQQSMQRSRAGWRTLDLIAGASAWSSTVPLYYWNTISNFGDRLAPAVTRSVTSLRPILVSKRFAKPKLLVVGTVVEYAKPGDACAGIGARGPGPWPRAAELEVFAVRGRLTADALRRPGVTVGDPGLLAAQIVDLPIRPPLNRIGIVPHFADFRLMKDVAPAGTIVINPGLPWPEVVRRVARCEAIAASSLHGLIVADALGKPSAWFERAEMPQGGRFKYLDYYSATDRAPAPTGLEKILSRPDRFLGEAVLPPLAPLRRAIVAAAQSVARCT